MFHKSITGLALAVGMMTAPAAVLAAEAKLPDTLVWTTYDTGGTMHANAVAISSTLKQQNGVNLRVLTAGNGIAQQTTLKLGKSDFVLAGFDVYYAQEGASVFAARDWGPQPVRLVITASSNQSYALAVDPAIGAKHPRDLKGKRIAFVKASASISQALNSLVLACGGLTWDDVEKVEVPGFGASVDAYMNDQVDVYYTTTNSATSIKANSAARGLGWVPIPHDDEKCWNAITEVDPRWVKKVATEGVNVPKEGIEMASYPEMILNTTADKDADYVYAMTKALYDNYENFKDAAPAAYGFALERQLLSYVVPYHEGAIRYYKEAGVWNDTLQAHQDKLVKKQEVLKEAWDKVVAKNISDDAEFAKAWKEARIEALTTAGFSVPVRDW
ncbi:MAG: TAXI family TRAP transporter solute-binding subunit [Rhodobiaceae bacterium]|nr:TAXI family TRAP transporter solute-binding subunit [Rhodobiaceae bacterium]MCC0056193.1 TAXI family TRAP transporter solute-binding subunit [Rhodobiaceae bacterium]